DTSGYILSFQIEKLLPYVDLFLYDLKIVDRTKHVFNTGVSNDLIKTNLWFLLQKGKNVIIRIPIIPGFNDSEEDKIEFVSFLRDFKTFQIEINLLPYHDVSEKYEALWQTRKKPGRKYNEIVLNSLKKDLERLNFTVKIGG
ncbi:MAG: glycyl-radical enzyme activating protein, partial [Pseudothermotoga sp.]|nr:glycyl-radical enzyme activating protein [Pseudothermotoga sp.]